MEEFHFVEVSTILAVCLAVLRICVRKRTVESSPGQLLSSFPSQVPENA